MFVDLEEDPAGNWKLERVSRVAEQLDVVLLGDWTGRGRHQLKMAVTNRSAWSQLQREPGSLWRVVLSLCD